MFKLAVRGGMLGGIARGGRADGVGEESGGGCGKRPPVGCGKGGGIEELGGG